MIHYQFITGQGSRYFNVPYSIKTFGKIPQLQMSMAIEKCHKIHWKRPAIEFFFIKNAGVEPTTLLKNDTMASVFLSNSAKLFKVAFL